MIAAATGPTLLAIWAAFAAASLLAMTGVFLWAVRSRQFSDQARLARLPLTCDAADQPQTTPDSPRGLKGPR